MSVAFRITALLVLAACADPIDAAPAAAPPAAALPPPTLAAGPLVAGEPFTITLRGVPAGAEARLAWGTAIRAGATCLRPRQCLDLVRARLLASGTADASGVVTFTGVLPDGLLGTELAVQPVLVGRGPGAPARLPLSSRPGMFGVWTDDYGFSTEVDVQVWRQPFGTWHIRDWSNTERWIIARNDAGNDYFPGMWSRFDWTVAGGRLWYCQTAYDAPDEAAARATPAADPSQPDVTGCGGFPWTGVEEVQPAIEGTWGDAFGGSHAIDATSWEQGWSAWVVSRYSNLDQVIIAQNDQSNPYDPGKWSRFDWTVVGGRTFYCQTAYDARSEWAARQTPRADDSDPMMTGCGGFPWTELL